MGKKTLLQDICLNKFKSFDLSSKETRQFVWIINFLFLLSSLCSFASLARSPDFLGRFFLDGIFFDNCPTPPYHKCSGPSLSLSNTLKANVNQANPMYSVVDQLFLD